MAKRFSKNRLTLRKLFLSCVYTLYKKIQLVEQELPAIIWYCCSTKKNFLSFFPFFLSTVYLSSTVCILLLVRANRKPVSQDNNIFLCHIRTCVKIIFICLFYKCYSIVSDLHKNISGISGYLIKILSEMIIIYNRKMIDIFLTK